MTITKNTYYYGIGLLLFVVLKLCYTALNNDAIIILTKPTSAIVALITNTSTTYNVDTGFYIEKLNIVIDKSCSGFNFCMLCFILFLFSFLKLKKSHVFKFATFPISLILAYLATLFVNTSRILISLLIEQKMGFHYKWLHQAQGVFIYLSFLILFFLLINYLQSKYIKNYEKLT